MDMKKIQRIESYAIVLTLRISKTDSEFLKEKNISPQALFREAISDLRKTQPTSKAKK